MKKFSTNDLEELVNAGLIDNATATKIETYYINRASSPNNRLTLAFGILGALLVGLGIILVLAHNWDELPRTVKTIIAFVPLILPQVLVWYTLSKKSDSVTWRESSAVLLFLGLGSCISLISQIYHIPGEIDSFLLTWMLLALPLTYLISSTASSLLYVVGITIYTMLTADNDSNTMDFILYVILLALAIPNYYFNIKNRTHSNFTTVQHWLFALSPMFTLGFFYSSGTAFIAFNNLSLFSILVAIGSFNFVAERPIWVNAYLLLGSLGFVVMMLVFSFDLLWGNEILFNRTGSGKLVNTIVDTLIVFSSSLLAGNNIRLKGFYRTRPESIVYLIFIPLFFFGISTPVFAQIATNLLILALGISIAYQGAQRNQLGLMNYGLLITVVLATCRFFDDEISFVVRGLLFVAVGTGFFVSNYLMIRKKKQL